MLAENPAYVSLKVENRPHPRVVSLLGERRIIQVEQKIGNFKY